MNLILANDLNDPMVQFVPVDFTDPFPVDLRDLHQALESKQRFSDWAKSRLTGFVEDEDFAINHNSMIKPRRGRPEINYRCALDIAKEISLMERTEVGKRVRRYFIRVEKGFRKLEAHLVQQQAELLRPRPITLPEIILDKADRFQIGKDGTVADFAAICALHRQLLAIPPADEPFLRWLLSSMQDYAAMGRTRVRRTLRDMLLDIPPLPNTVRNRASALGQRLKKFAEHEFPYDAQHSLRLYPERDRATRYWVMELVPNHSRN